MRLSVNIARFRPGSPRSRKLPLSAAAHLRIAQIGARSCFDGARAFPASAIPELELFRPRVIVACAPDLQHLAELVELGRIELSSLDHAIFLLTPCGHPPATDTLRVVLWQAFGVPVYELLMSPSGALLAHECEAHEGLHLAPGLTATAALSHELIAHEPNRAATPTGLTGQLSADTCPCGRAGARILNPQSASAASAGRLRLAATA